MQVENLYVIKWNSVYILHHNDNGDLIVYNQIRVILELKVSWDTSNFHVSIILHWNRCRQDLLALASTDWWIKFEVEHIVKSNLIFIEHSESGNHESNTRCLQHNT